jgi:hypothetical protein
MPLSDHLLYRRANRLTRPWTRQARALPDYIVIGAQKSGSSTLYAQLRSHPANVRAEIKECHFFDTPRPDHSAARYRRHFPLRAHKALRRTVVGGAVTGEATPSYLFHPLVPARMQAAVPQVKLIAVLREPIGRAISHYAMARRNGLEPLDFADAIRAEDDRLAPEWDRLARGEEPTRGFRVHSYAARGRYAEQLARYLEHFDRDQILVLTSDALRHDLHATLERCRRHIGMPDVGWRMEERHVNVGTKKPEVTAEDLAFLRERFADSNARLADEWGIDFRGAR